MSSNTSRSTAESASLQNATPSALSGGNDRAPANAGRGSAILMDHDYPDGTFLQGTPAGRSSAHFQHFLCFNGMNVPGKDCVALCKYCIVEIKYTNGTTALKNHYEGKHETAEQQAQRNAHKRKGTPRSINSFLVKKSSREDTREKVLRSTVAWIMETNQPLVTAENLSFRRMMESVNTAAPKFHVRPIKAEIKALGFIAKKAVIKHMSKQYFSVTTDHWTSPNDETYSCLTAHWIEQGKLERSVLAFEVFHGSTRGVDLGKSFQQQFLEMDIDLKSIITVVTDTTGNMNTFGRYLQTINVHHLYCFDHNVQLTAKHAYNGQYA
jgi:hypothetical protein